MPPPPQSPSPTVMDAAYHPLRVGYEVELSEEDDAPPGPHRIQAINGDALVLVPTTGPRVERIAIAETVTRLSHPAHDSVGKPLAVFDEVTLSVDGEQQTYWVQEIMGSTLVLVPSTGPVVEQIAASSKVSLITSGEPAE